MYSTIDLIKSKINISVLIQLLNDAGKPEDEIDLTDSTEEVVINFNKMATAAKEEIDPYCRGRYTLPFASTPLVIIDISDDITIYNCHKRRGSVPEDISNFYKDAVKKLEKVEAGKMDLGIVTEPQSISNEIKTNKTAEDRIFNTDMWNKF